MMIFQYHFVLSALLLCLLLAGVLGVFGHHVVRRGVIFVDLALAQVAALGSSVGILLGWGEDRPAGNFALSLAFTLAGAALFSWFRSRRNAPIEALIGITYAGAMALSLLVLEKSATGSEELKEMLVGSILTVPAWELRVAGFLAGAVGLFLWLAREPLFRITADPERAAASGLRLGFWDFLFYAAFGVMVTFSVKAAGVLLVFAFLIVPSLASIMTLSGTRARLLFGWAFGFAGCVLGLELSLRMDWSAGPSIVAMFILLLVFSGMIAGRIGGKQRHF
jgi:zinc/manganese transport system permease protein